MLTIWHFRVIRWEEQKEGQRARATRKEGRKETGRGRKSRLIPFSLLILLSGLSIIDRSVYRRLNFRPSSILPLLLLPAIVLLMLLLQFSHVRESKKSNALPIPITTTTSTHLSVTELSHDYAVEGRPRPEADVCSVLFLFGRRRRAVIAFCSFSRVEEVVLSFFVLHRLQFAERALFSAKPERTERKTELNGGERGEGPELRPHGERGMAGREGGLAQQSYGPISFGTPNYFCCCACDK